MVTTLQTAAVPDATRSRVSPRATGRHAAEADRTERLWIVALGAIVVAQLWFGMIATSFWLDETGTWWIVKDGAAEAVRRAFFWSGQSPLFYLIAWLSSRVFGLNEIALRIPSVIAMSGAIFFLYRIAERLYDRASAATVVFVFLCAASFFAVDARPYALAIFCLTAATWGLLNWLDRGGARHATLFVVAGTLTVYAHCVLSLGLAPGIVFGVVTARRDRSRLARLGSMTLAIALLCLPLAPQLLRFYVTRSAHTSSAPPGAGDLLAGLVPCSLAGALVLIVWTFMVFRRKVALSGKCTGNAALLIGVWALFAPALLALLASGSDLQLFVSRYYSSAMPGQAPLIGGLLSSIRPRVARKALLLSLGVGAIFLQGRLRVESHGYEDWRAAMQFVRKEAGSAPVLLVSPFAEATGFHSIGNPKLRDVLFAPELLYGEPGNSIRLPHVFAAREHEQLESIARRLKDERRIFLVNDKPDRSYETWLAGRLASRCASEPLEQTFGYIWVARFICEKQ